MNFLIDLPDSLARSVLTTWFGIRDIAHLDDAHCSRRQRALFHQIAFHPDTVYSFELEQHTATSSVRNDYVKWLWLHDIRVKSVSFPAVSPLKDDSLARKFFRRCGAALRKIEIEGSSDAGSFYSRDNVILCIADFSPGVRELVLNSCIIERHDTMVKLLARCPEIDSFTINTRWFFQQQTKKSVESLYACISKHCPPLKKLSIESNIPAPSLFSVLIPCCVGLTSLNITDCTWCEDDDIALVTQHCPKLKEIYLSNMKLSDETLISLVTTCKHLTVFDVVNIPLSDAVVLAVAEHCAHLTHVGFVACVRLTEGAIVTLVNQRGANLETISLDHNNQVTDVTLAAISASCKQLYELHLYACPNISDVGLLAVHSGIPDLYMLEIDLQCSRRVSHEVSRLFGEDLSEEEGGGGEEEGEGEYGSDMIMANFNVLYNRK